MMEVHGSFPWTLVGGSGLQSMASVDPTTSIANLSQTVDRVDHCVRCAALARASPRTVHD